MAPLLALLFFCFCFLIDLLTGGATGGFWVPYAQVCLNWALHIIGVGVKILESFQQLLPKN